MTNEQIQEFKDIRDAHLKTYHNLEFYPYQRLCSDAIIRRFLGDEGGDLAFEFARQSGKTTAIVHTVETLLLYAPSYLGYPITVCIFAPQKEQAATDLDRLKTALSDRGVVEIWGVPEEKNANTLGLSNGSEIYIFPLTATSNPESKTSHLNIYEEAHNIDDRERAIKADPMLASTNGSKVFIGNAGFRICHFYKMLERAGAAPEVPKDFPQGKDGVYIADYNQVIKERKERYGQDGNPQHLKYERYVEGERIKLGDAWEQDEPFKTAYRLAWVLGRGQFITQADIQRITGEYDALISKLASDCYIGIDTAKVPDSTEIGRAHV